MYQSTIRMYVFYHWCCSSPLHMKCKHAHLLKKNEMICDQHLTKWHETKWEDSADYKGYWHYKENTQKLGHIARTIDKTVR